MGIDMLRQPSISAFEKISGVDNGKMEGVWNKLSEIPDEDGENMDLVSQKYRFVCTKNSVGNFSKSDHFSICVASRDEEEEDGSNVGIVLIRLREGFEVAQDSKAKKQVLTALEVNEFLDQILKSVPSRPGESPLDPKGKVGSLVQGIRHQFGLQQ